MKIQLTQEGIEFLGIADTDEVFEAHEVWAGLSTIGCQLLSGKHRGKILSSVRYIVLPEEEKVELPNLERLEMEIDEMIAEWNSSDFEGSPIADRKAFSKRLTDFIIKELT